MATMLSSFSSLPASVSHDTVLTRNQGYANEDDWCDYEAIIKRLYKKNTLAKVMKFMESEYGFKST